MTFRLLLITAFIALLTLIGEQYMSVACRMLPGHIAVGEVKRYCDWVGSSPYGVGPIPRGIPR